MYRPSMYDKHDETMLKFVEKFNGSLVCKNIEMRPNKVETYDNDGIFIDIYTNQSIGYDWEYRDRYFEHCKLEFESLGQYERKLEKKSIQISLQCDSTETGIAVGWHEDWLQEERERRALRTDSSWKENASIRYTNKFKIYSFSKIDLFKNMVASAMRLQEYSSKIFKIMTETVNSGIVVSRTNMPQTKQLSSHEAKSKSNAKTLVDFFKSKGLEIVDKRPNGGCLWVIGNENEIGLVVREACRKFHVGGNYGTEKEICQKQGWFTRARK